MIHSKEASVRSHTTTLSVLLSIFLSSACGSDSEPTTSPGNPDAANPDATAVSDAQPADTSVDVDAEVADASIESLDATIDAADASADTMDSATDAYADPIDIAVDTTRLHFFDLDTEQAIGG